MIILLYSSLNEKFHIFIHIKTKWVSRNEQEEDTSTYYTESLIYWVKIKKKKKLEEFQPQSVATINGFGFVKQEESHNVILYEGNQDLVEYTDKRAGADVNELSSFLALSMCLHFTFYTSRRALLILNFDTWERKLTRYVLYFLI